jgi:hypothetical protein
VASHLVQSILDLMRKAADSAQLQERRAALDAVHGPKRRVNRLFIMRRTPELGHPRR